MSHGERPLERRPDVRRHDLRASGKLGHLSRVFDHPLEQVDPLLAQPSEQQVIHRGEAGAIQVDPGERSMHLARLCIGYLRGQHGDRAARREQVDAAGAGEHLVEEQLRQGLVDEIGVGAPTEQPIVLAREGLVRRERLGSCDPSCERAERGYPRANRVVLARRVADDPGVHQMLREAHREARIAARHLVDPLADQPDVGHLPEHRFEQPLRLCSSEGREAELAGAARQHLERPLGGAPREALDRHDEEQPSLFHAVGQGGHQRRRGLIQPVHVVDGDRDRMREGQMLDPAT